MSKKIIILKCKSHWEEFNLTADKISLVIKHASSDWNDNITEPCINAYCTLYCTLSTESINCSCWGSMIAQTVCLISYCALRISPLLFVRIFLLLFVERIFLHYLSMSVTTDHVSPLTPIISNNTDTSHCKVHTVNQLTQQSCESFCIFSVHNLSCRITKLWGGEVSRNIKGLSASLCQEVMRKEITQFIIIRMESNSRGQKQGWTLKQVRKWDTAIGLLTPP